ncbi:glycosyltransferase family 4 protein [Polaribacter vadi]|uniref:glycosyltransferase family 4 protein n=1 Tax=Polaribacter TaxID=52959 RepID=UPI001C09734B|nr:MULTISPECIES: glycosyltransferase family 4 protein [Polaribacter]MBU3010521.1 glycosyltransferase family 4 protein [Polaribacter vadi]MDO6740329.1 glycosyltransferase family 4 protein [Polaribacter sp. 1_MG-2023]
MRKNILYILSSYNRFSGTPKKTFDLIEHSNNNSFLYVWSTAYSNEFKDGFKNITEKIFEGNYGRNLLKHIKKLINIIDENNIEIIQTQFFFGELLGGILKALKPNIKLIVTFEGAMSAGFIKRNIQKLIYKKVDAFIYISKYVKTEKEKVFPQLKQSETLIIYNGTDKLKVDETLAINKENNFSLLSVSSLINIKNIDVLIDMMQLLSINKQQDIHLFIAGDGVHKKELEAKVKAHKIENRVHFLGRQKAIGNLLANADVIVHPCYIEGFGLSVVEAMMAEKPVIVSNSGALPEIVEHKKTGFLVNPFKAEDWQKAILELKKNKDLANKIAKNARIKAEQDFSVKNFVNNYNLFYQKL